MIRYATADDIPKLIKLKGTVGRDTYYDFGTPQEFDAWMDSVCSEAYFEDLLDKGATILVAEYDTAFLGMASVTFNCNSALFGNLYVGLQNRGIGSLLTNHRLALVENHTALMSPNTEFEVRASCFYQNYVAYKHLVKHGFIPYSWAFNENYTNTPMVWMKHTIVTSDSNLLL